MLQCVARTLAALALCCAVGLHWAVIQSFAWTAMILDYSKCAPIQQAIARTFDGAHPCALCHAINKGKADDHKRDLQVTALKIDLVCVTRPVQFRRGVASFRYRAIEFLFSEREHSPPVPPPKRVWV